MSNQGRDEILIKMILEKLGRMISLSRIFSDVIVNGENLLSTFKGLEISEALKEKSLKTTSSRLSFIDKKTEIKWLAQGNGVALTDLESSSRFLLLVEWILKPGGLSLYHSSLKTSI